MNRPIRLTGLTVFLISLCGPAPAAKDFVGTIESRPESKAGTWVIGGQTFEVTERTGLDEGNGPLEVGACAEVETRGAVVSEIDRVSKRRCRK